MNVAPAHDRCSDLIGYPNGYYNGGGYAATHHGRVSEEDLRGADLLTNFANASYGHE